MARKRLLQDPPSPDSSTEETSFSQEPDHRIQNKTTPTKNSTVAAAASSDSDDESDSNDSLSSPSASDFTIKPIVSKPIQDSGEPSTADTGGRKRTSVNDVKGKESKKNKLSNANGSGCIQRLWSDDDQIAILKGLIEYRSEVGADPCAEMEAFYEFVKKNLEVDASISQLKDKIKRLKGKYRIHAEKCENGEDPVLRKSHEHKLFELSKKFWGYVVTKGVHNSNKKKPTQSEVKTFALALLNNEINVEPTSSNSSFLDMLLATGKHLSLPEGVIGVVKEALPLIDSTRTNELENRWKKLHKEEFELYLKRVEFFRHCANVLSESLVS